MKKSESLFSPIYPVEDDHSVNDFDDSCDTPTLSLTCAVLLTSSYVYVNFISCRICDITSIPLNPPLTEIDARKKMPKVSFSVNYFILMGIPNFHVMYVLHTTWSALFDKRVKDKETKPK